MTEPRMEDTVSERSVAIAEMVAAGVDRLLKHEPARLDFKVLMVELGAEPEMVAMITAESTWWTDLVPMVVGAIAGTEENQ